VKVKKGLGAPYVRFQLGKEEIEEWRRIYCEKEKTYTRRRRDLKGVGIPVKGKTVRAEGRRGA